MGSGRYYTPAPTMESGGRLPSPPRLASVLDDLQTDFRDAHSDHAEALGGGVRKIDDAASGAIGASVGDANVDDRAGICGGPCGPSGRQCTIHRVR